MPTLYPLLLKPEFHHRVWGTRDLRPIYDLQPDEAIGEAWLTGDGCRVANGELAGRTLGELCRDFGSDLVGEAAPQKDRFPLLIKFLFPREKLSVQVHPDDEMARNLGQPCGKTECWYVLAAEPGAQVGVGLKPGITKSQFAEAIQSGTAERLLNWIDVHAGELIYVEAGTVHAIGPGSILVETQQNSDTTFRLYDYGRPRELHLEQGLAALKHQTRSGKQQPMKGDALDCLVLSPHFVVTAFTLKSEEMTFSGSGSNCKVIVPTRGNALVTTANGPGFEVRAGEALVAPAVGGEFTLSAPDSEFSALVSFLPGREVKFPAAAGSLAMSL